MSTSMTTATEKTELSRLLRQCAKGSTIAIQRGEKTLAYLVPRAAEPQPNAQRSTSNV